MNKEKILKKSQEYTNIIQKDSHQIVILDLIEHDHVLPYIDDSQ